MADLEAAKRTLLSELREHSLVIGEVTLASGATAQYYVDARRALLRPAGFRAAGELIAAVVEDTVTTGGSTVRAIEKVKEQGLEPVSVIAVVDRLAGGGEAIEASAAAPYRALVTIDEIYPGRPDRG